jgi:mannose-6-phosphate isomerase
MPSLTEPLRFRRHEVPKPWGGRALERCPGIRLASAGAVGETWEVVDRPGENSVVDAGPHAGRTLGELVREHGRDLLGAARPTPHGRFPVLVKYIDAQKNLSVQVHPDEEGARSLGHGAEAKTEAWYVLAVERDPRAAEPKLGRIYAGLKADLLPERFAEIAASRAVLSGLLSWDASPGTCMVVPGGTVHAIGAGVTLLEVQQNSDTTYRVWDWDRLGDDGQPRPTHVAEALAAARFDLPQRPPIPPVFEPAGAHVERAPLARSRTFAMNLLRISARARLSTRNQFQIYAAVEGSGRLAPRTGAEAVDVRQGDVWLVPAAAGFHDLEPTGERLTLVQILSKA